MNGYTSSYHTCLILDSYTPPLKRRLHDCVANHSIAIAVFESGHSFIVDYGVEEVGNHVIDGDPVSTL